MEQREYISFLRNIEQYGSLDRFTVLHSLWTEKQEKGKGRGRKTCVERDPGKLPCGSGTGMGASDQIYSKLYAGPDIHDRDMRSDPVRGSKHINSTSDAGEDAAEPDLSADLVHLLRRMGR